MLQFHQGKVFLFNDNKSSSGAFDDFFASRALHMFGSDNLYQLIRYANEISPDLMIFNLQSSPETDFSPLHYFNNAVKLVNYPIIILQNENNPFPIHPNIAHYLRIPRDMPKLIDITESYGIGHQNHQILLIDAYKEETDNLHNSLANETLAFFEVHNERAAELYLQKNTPDIICIEHTIQLTQLIKNASINNRIFYVDRDKDITEIKKFLH